MNKDPNFDAKVYSVPLRLSRFLRSLRKGCYVFVAGGLLAFLNFTRLDAQVTFKDAITLAIKNSPRIKIAQNDRERASAAVAEVKDAYIPSASLGGGVGKSYGITLTVPTIVTTNVQSLVYSAAQRDYLRGVKDSLRASELNLEDVRQQVEEDTAINYVSLDTAAERYSVLKDQYQLAMKRLSITEQRADAGLATQLDLMKSRRSALQVRMQLPQLAGEISALQEHLSGLLQIPAETIVTDASSIPAHASASALLNSAEFTSDTPMIRAANENADAKAHQLRGDEHYAFRPQVFFQSQYGRISPVNDVSAYYNLNGKYNTLYYAASIQLPIFDRVHAAKARETMAESMRLKHEAQLATDKQKEDLIRLKNSQQELSSKVDLAEMDWEISRDQLSLMLVEVNTSSSDQTGGRQMNPQDEVDARLEERERYADYLDARLQLQKTQISLLRQAGDLEAWLGTSGK